MVKVPDARGLFERPSGQGMEGLPGAINVTFIRLAPVRGV